MLGNVEEEPLFALDAHGNVEERLVVMTDEDANAILGILVVFDRPAENIRLSAVFSQLTNLNVDVV